MQGEKSTCGRRSVSQGEEGPSSEGRKGRDRLTPMIEREKRKRKRREGIAAASAEKKDENFRALIRRRVNTAGRAGNLRNQNEMRKILLHAIGRVMGKKAIALS